MLAPERARARAVRRARSRATAPSSRPALLEPDELRRARAGAWRTGLWGCRLETGYPVRPMAATRAFAKRAYAAGARFHEGETAWPWVIGARARGVLAAGVRRPAGAVLVAAGPWTPEVIDPTRAWQPIVPVWGVVAEVEMDDPPRHVLEEVGRGGRGRRRGRRGVDLQPGGRRTGRSRWARPSSRSSPTAPAWAPRCGAAASASCPVCGARRWSARGPARARSRSTAPARGGVPGRRALGRAATGRGASRPARPRPGSRRTRCSAGRGAAPLWRARLAPPRPGRADDHRVRDLVISSPKPDASACLRMASLWPRRCSRCRAAVVLLST